MYVCVGGFFFLLLFFSSSEAYYLSLSLSLSLSLCLSVLDYVSAETLALVYSPSFFYALDSRQALKRFF